MKLKFKKQKYQEDAVQSVIKCFEGQTKGYEKKILDSKKEKIDKGTLYERIIEKEIFTFKNKEIELTEQEIRKNIKSVQKSNDLNYTDNQGTTNFSIEMETGTGKTYTYIKTMYELNKEYGWSKFIVMVPSIAIREGVLKSFQITEEHFQELYHKKIRYFVYNSANSSNISNIKNFAEDSNIQVMIINYQAFNARSKANRRIYEELDLLQSRRPIDVLKATNPILIIDEPQKIGKTEKILKEFNPLFILRYSATHKENFKYNMIYRLDAVDAYNQELVKKINVKGIEILHNKSESAYLYLESVEISKSSPIARMEIEVKSKNGTKKVFKNLKKGDNLYKISQGLESYKGYKISEINAQNESYDKVIFSNGTEILTGQILGNTEENCMSRIQIRETIKEHFEKEKEYHKLGIKVLSLFFIDEVVKYKEYDENNYPHDGEYAKIFEEEYNKIFNEYYENANNDYKGYLDSLKGKKVHAGYFSIDKKASKGKNEDEYVYIDSKIDDKKEGTSSDEDAYDLIMKDKERLLSLDEPVRFIFSHSALREGWDNPNIFQICTLKKSNSEISKRQEIGRGLRICVNKDGERMDASVLEEEFFDINNLTVIASESYKSFVSSLQKEISENLSRQVVTKLTPDLFENKILKNNEGKQLKLDENYNQIFVNCLINEYVDADGNITQKFKDDIYENKIKVPEIMNDFKTEYSNLMKKLFTTMEIPIENKNKNNIKTLKPNDNFNEEFKKLWNKINIQTVYEVNFDSNELIEKAIKALNKELKIAKMRIKITTGEQKQKISINQLKEENAMNEVKSQTEVYEDIIPITTKYDLIGSISKETGLTRKTIIKILSQIEKETFEQYKYNPEEFIRKASNIINTEKGNTIIDGLKYRKINKTYNDDIFIINNANGRLNQNAIQVKKHIYDYLITDSEIERKFAERMEKEEVLVYAKLPRGFKIPTPVGNYNPDWAIVFSNKKCKYIYFVAETKGSMNKSKLNPIETAKIECAKKHFKEISDGEFDYGVVDNYDSLIDLLYK